MPNDMLSRALTVEAPKAAQALLEPASQAMVLAFTGAPKSIAAVARAHGFDLKRLHHHVQRFCRLGLLEVAEVRARAGRPIKLYRTTAPAFFVPHAAARELATEQLARDLREGLKLAARRPGKGFFVYADADGVAHREPARGDAPPEAAEMWRILRLSTAEMAELSAELDELLTRYLRNAKGPGRTYLLHAALAPWVSPDAPIEAPEPAPKPAAVTGQWSAGGRVRVAVR
jgi:hypothetical protein